MNVILKLAIMAAATMSMSACCECDKTKFNAKEYAERKTERLDKIVDLTDAQEKEVYAVYLAQGKEIQKNIKTLKKECGDVKCPDGKKAECKKAECNKPCAKKAECKKAECDKPCAKKAECKDGCKHNHIAKGKHPRHPEMLSRESRKANRALIRGILTPEQGEKLKEHFAKRHQCAPNAKQCVPTPKTDCKEVK